MFKEHIPIPGQIWKGHHNIFPVFIESVTDDGVGFRIIGLSDRKYREEVQYFDIVSFISMFYKIQ